MLGLPGDNTYANFQEANRAFWRQSVIPLVGRLQKCFAAWLTPAYGTLRFDANLDHIDALAEERTLEWRRIGEAGFLTLDEQRAAAGYGPAPQGFSAKGGNALELRYSPDQPRAPAGASDGGRWLSAGGGGGSGVARNAGNGMRREGFGQSGSELGGGLIDSAHIPALLGGAPADTTQGILIAGNDDPKVANDAVRSIDFTQNYSINLSDEANFGHAKTRHVGKSDSELINELEKKRKIYKLPLLGEVISFKPSQSSFDSLESANDFVNRIIESNLEIVEEVRSGKRDTETLIKHFGYRTGKEAYLQSGKSEPIIRPTYEALAMIYHDPRRPNGFSVLTAYPFNYRPGKR